MHMGYVRWCAQNGHKPMPIHRFGAGAPWVKRKIGGVVRYLDCQLVESYRSQPLRVVAASG